MAYTDEDFRNLIAALAKYTDESMDQFDHLQYTSRFGPIYVAIEMKPPTGYPQAAFRDVSELIGPER